MASTVEIARSLGLSPQSTMGNGYGGQRRSLETMDDVWNWAVLHPWMKAAETVLFFSHPRTVRVGFDARGLPILDTPLGNGSSGRDAGEAARINFWKRNSRTPLAGRPRRNTPEGPAWLKPGMAPIAYPGDSNHERDTYQNYSMSTDAVGWEDGWMGTYVSRVGLKTFWNVGSEPWHLQPAGYGNSKLDLQRDLAARGLPAFNLPAIPLAIKPTPPPPPPPVSLFLEMTNMNFLAEHRRIVDTRQTGGPLQPGQVRKIPLGMLNIAFLNITAIGPQGGFISVGGSPAASPGTSACNYDADGIVSNLVAGAFPDGHAYVKANVHACNFIIDMQVFGAA